MAHPEAYTDDSYMEIGKAYSGMRLADVPYSYFRWYYGLYDIWFKRAKKQDRNEYMTSNPKIKVRYLLCEYIESSVPDLDYVPEESN